MYDIMKAKHFIRLLSAERRLLTMRSLFEKQDSLNAPIETFDFDSSVIPLPVKLHWHYFAEFIYMLKGSALVTCDDTEYIVNAGELITIPPSSVHSIFPANDSVPQFVGVKFDPGKFPNTTSYAPSVGDIFRYACANGMRIHFSAPLADELRCREIFRDCIGETAGFLFGRDVMLRAHVYRLIYGMFRLWIDEGLDIGSCPVRSEEIFGIENVTEYIDSCLEDNVRVADIAEKCHMSYSSFAAKFREQYGMSCKEYIERMRIYKAEEYLLFTDHDLNYISQQTGFSDCSHFIRNFRKYRGVTPKQFRLQKKLAKP